MALTIDTIFLSFFSNGPRTLRDPWKEGTLIVRKIIERLSSVKQDILARNTLISKYFQKYREIDVGLTVFIGNVFITLDFKTSGSHLIYHIDTNPAFSVYTETAVAAADRLIIPINADDFR